MPSKDIQGQFLFLVILNQKATNWKHQFGKLQSDIWGNYNNSGSSPVYRYRTKPQRQLTGLESNTYKGTNIISPPITTPILLTKDNHSNTHLFALNMT